MSFSTESAVSTKPTMSDIESTLQTLSLTVEQALQRAVTHHQAGRLQDAERLYRAILQAQPNHSDANHNLGVLAVQVKQPAVGLAHFKAALEANPNLGQYWLSYIDALVQTGHLGVARKMLELGRQRGLDGGEVVAALAQRIESDMQSLGQSEKEHQQTVRESPLVSSVTPQNRREETKSMPPRSDKLSRKTGLSKMKSPSSQEINTLATLFADGRHSEVELLATTMTIRFPRHGFGWKVLGVVLGQMGRSAEALPSLEKAAALMPKDVVTHYNLGNVLKDLGQLKDAVASYRRALEIKPDFVAAHNNLGNVLKDLGQFNDAAASYRRALEIKPDFAAAHNNLGNVLRDLGRLDDAVNSYRMAREIKPDYAEAHSNLGNALRDLGRLDDAATSYRMSLEIKPDYAVAHNNLGNVLRDLGQLDDAVTSYRIALKIKPDYAEAHNNLGNALKDLGRLDDAVTSYRMALEIKPDYAEAHSNLGVTLNALGQFDTAVTSYRRALEIKPDCATALNNLALLLNAQGKSAKSGETQSMNCIMQSLRLKETVEAKNTFVACVRHLHIAADNAEVRLALVRALTEPWGRPTDLARICINFVKLNPDIQKAMARADNAWPLRLSVQDLFGPNGLSTLQSDPLLRALLNSALIDDIETERFLTMVRHAMLEAIDGTKASECVTSMALDFYSTLANQCFINEYVFSYTDAEIKKASNLRNLLVAALEAGTEVPMFLPIAVATYFPLFSIKLASRLLNTHWPDQVMTVLKRQICEPEEERRLRATISRVTNIEDDVSLLVQNQYEDNPYPRWIRAAPTPKAMHVLGYLSQKFPLADLKYHARAGNIEVLIAGCGTGQHSIATAKQLNRAAVLAVDLSLSSLSYAKRKTQELGLVSIEYVQADLLNLGEIGRHFDIIESVGVLHHIANPWAGWRVLLSILRPGGFMKLGFYSELARRDIVKARAIIAEKAYGTTANEIRKCRQYLIDLDKHENLGAAVRSPDFFSTSACRDLLFHVQEHRMTLAAIDSFLRENNLSFLGFELDHGMVSTYRLRFPGDKTLTNLDQWQLFERENPDTFLGMYQFWIQKPSSD